MAYMMEEHEVTASQSGSKRPARGPHQLCRKLFCIPRRSMLKTKYCYSITMIHGVAIDIKAELQLRICHLAHEGSRNSNCGPLLKKAVHERVTTPVDETFSGFLSDISRSNAGAEQRTKATFWVRKAAKQFLFERISRIYLRIVHCVVNPMCSDYFGSILPKDLYESRVKVFYLSAIPVSSISILNALQITIDIKVEGEVEDISSRVSFNTFNFLEVANATFARQKHAVFDSSHDLDVHFLKSTHKYSMELAENTAVAATSEKNIFKETSLKLTTVENLDILHCSDLVPQIDWRTRWEHEPQQKNKKKIFSCLFCDTQLSMFEKHPHKSCLKSDGIFIQDPYSVAKLRMFPINHDDIIMHNTITTLTRIKITIFD
ncbi:hypothetical protein RF11_04109 [Thelohanellus kitauei]|uniref:Uncharacterized protein n=1 Tax=Thelohanellus kitauei TaxID=669202 RepID=A0A0C2MFB1_THEKT|nr:hypothetical protein RF11_04109 [Thelohanellus kitauei]